MRRGPVPARAALTLLLASSLQVPAPIRAESATCIGTLSGAAKGTFECDAFVTRGEDGVHTFVIRSRTPIPDVPAYQPGSFQLPDAPRPGTLELDRLGPGLSSVAVEGGALYTASRTTSTRGEVVLVLDAVRGPERDGTWGVSGTFRARLRPVGAGRSGEVVVHVRF